MGNACSGGRNLESWEDSHRKPFEEEVGSLLPTDSSAATAVSRLMQSRNILEDPACLNPSSVFVPLRKCSQPCLRIRSGADLLTTRTAANHPVGLRHRTIAAEEIAQISCSSGPHPTSSSNDLRLRMLTTTTVGSRRASLSEL